MANDPHNKTFEPSSDEIEVRDDIVKHAMAHFRKFYAPDARCSLWPVLQDLWDACARLDVEQKPNPWKLLDNHPLRNGPYSAQRRDAWKQEVEDALAWRDRQ